MYSLSWEGIWTSYYHVEEEKWEKKIGFLFFAFTISFSLAIVLNQTNTAIEGWNWKQLVNV